MAGQANFKAGRVLVFERMDPTDASIQWLKKQGLELMLGRPMWAPPYRNYSQQEIISAAQGQDAVMGASGARFTDQVLEQLPSLQCISKFGVGFETIDIDAATARGILVSNTPEDSEVSDVAEHTIGMILALRKQLLHWTPSYMKNGGWRPGFFGDSLAGSTVGIIGLGHIGRAVAQRLASWKMRLLGYDPYAVGAPSEVSLTDLPTLLSEADVITLHASPSATNRHLINAAALAQLKSTCILINTARASLVDTAALCDSLRRGALGGAAVDVYDEEPPDRASELFTLDNVIVTPHTAAWTRIGLENIGWHAARNLVAMLSGSGHADVVNPEAYGKRKRS